MTDFATLKSDVADWIIDEDLTAQIPGFVRICESEIRRKVRNRGLEQSTTIAVASRSTALPAGFLSLRSLTRQDGYSLEYMTPEKIRESAEWTDGARISAYTIEGDNLVVAPAPSASVTLDIVYLKSYDALSGDSDTNWLLTNVYDLYLYGALKHAAAYVEDIELEAKYATHFDRVVEELNREQKLSRVGGSSRVRRGIDPP